MAPIVLIGPIAAGKSSVAQYLSVRTSRRNVPLDDIRWFYYYQQGYDYLEERRRVREYGPLARFLYWKPFEVHAVERVLVDFPEAIIDFGAGYTVQDDEAHFARVQAALAQLPFVFQLRPASGVEESITILSERVPPEDRDHVSRLNWTFLRSPCNARLATHTVLTGRRSVEEVGEEIFSLLA